MPRRDLTNEWSMDLHESFRGRVVDGDLQLVSPGPPVRTIWIAVWNPPADMSPTDVLDGISRNAPVSPEMRFEEQGVDANEFRYGSWYAETVEDRKQWGLYAYTVRPGSHVQAAFLTDEEADLDWALTTWRSLRFQP